MKLIEFIGIPGSGKTSIVSEVFFYLDQKGLHTIKRISLYDALLGSKGEVKVTAYLSPTLNFHNNQGLRYAVSFDDESPHIVNMHAGKNFQDWEESVRNNITMTESKHVIVQTGEHVLKFWAVDPGVVLQKLVVRTGEMQPSYLGPPESYINR